MDIPHTRSLDWSPFSADQTVEIDMLSLQLSQSSKEIKRELLLHEAAITNDISTAKKLIDAKVDVNSRSHMDRAPIHWAASRGHLDILAMLIMAKCDIESSDKYGMKPLLLAAWFGHKGAVQMLVENGCNCRRTNKGLTALHCAVQNNHVDVVNFLLESVENISVNSSDRNRQTPLHLAVLNNNMEIVEKLIQYEADVSLKDKTGSTAVHLAAEKGHYLILVRLLRVGAEIEDRDQEGRTALHLAAQHNHQMVAKVLLEYNCNSESEEAQKECNPLHIAALLGHADIVSTLLDFGANLNRKEKHGNTPLHLAVMGNHLHMAKLLLQKGAPVNITNNIFGFSSTITYYFAFLHKKRLQTPLHLAAELGFTEIAEVLLTSGADAQVMEKGGRTALYIAARGSFTTIVDLLVCVERDNKSNMEQNSHSPVHVDKCAYGVEQGEITQKQMKQVFWTLAKSYLEPNDWKHIARYWKFNEEHIKAIEHQYTGKLSYKEHGYRMMLIWLHGLPATKNPFKELSEALVVIGKQDLAEKIHRKMEEDYVPRKCPPEELCVMCSVL